MKSIGTFLIFVGLSTVTANWDLNFQLFKAIENEGYQNLSGHLVELERGLSNVTNQNIIALICSLLRENSEIFSPENLIKRSAAEAATDAPEGESDELVCIIQSVTIIQNACNLQIWPFVVIDAWAKIQSGFASGNIRNPGAFDQCIKISVPLENEYARGPLVGKHCNLGIGKHINGTLDFSGLPQFIRDLLDRFFPTEPILDIGGRIRDDLPLFVDIGVCVPKVCSNELILLVTRMITFLLGLGPTEFTTNNIDKFCNVQEMPPFGIMEWGAISLIIGGFAGMILSTLYEVICVKIKAKPNEMTAAMSLYSNGKYLFTMRQKKDHIQVLHGLRALSLIWLMLGYRFILPLIVPLINPLDFATDFMDSYFAPWIFASQFGTDVLLFLNATLITYLFMCKMQKSGHVRIWKLYIYRLMRVTPFIGILIFFMMTLTPYQSNGPYYRFLTEAQIPACEEYWWSAMFHLQNYVNPDTLCVLHTYFFSIDMQLFWAAPILLFPLYFIGPFFLIFVFICFGLAIACATTVSYFYGFQAFIINNVVPFEKLTQYLRMIFFATHVRMGPWLIGVICGYIIYKLKDGNRRINYFLSAFLWIISLSGIIAVVYLLYPFHQIDHIQKNIISEAEIPNAFNYLYIGFARNILALCLCWIVIGSYTGTGGIISWLFSLSVWQPLSKMSISIYIVSLSAQMVMIASWKTPYVFGISEMLQAFQSDILIVFLFSCMTYLMIERPIMRVVKFILKIGQKPEEEDGFKDDQLKFEQRASPWKSFY